MATDKTATDRHSGTAARDDAALPERDVVRLLAVLSTAAGCIDAVCLIRLGGMFASVITGNLVQLGRAVAAVDGRMAASATAAIGGYALGVAASTLPLRGIEGWRRRVSLAALVEAMLLIGVAAGWLASGAHPGPIAAMLLLALAAIAMGVQSAVTISSGVGGAATTYLTGTLTSVVRALAGHRPRFAPTAGGAARLAALLCGAAVGALILRVAPLLAPLLAAVLVAAVAVVAGALARVRTEGRP